MASKGIRDRVAIVGMGCTPFGERWDRGVEDLLTDAVKETIASAGVPLADIDAFWLGTMGSGVSGITLSKPLKLDYKPVSRLENFCATGSEAFRNACYAVASGAYDLAMAIGVEKLKDSGYSGLVSVRPVGDGTDAALSSPAAFSFLAPAYGHKYGVDEAQMKDVLTRIAWKNHRNGAVNPRAQFRKEVSKETIAASPLVAGQLGVFDCSGVSDGSAAAIICRAEDAHRYTDHPLYVKAPGPPPGPSTPGTTTRRSRRSCAQPRTPTARRASPIPGRSWPWPRSMTASRRPSSSSWRTSGSPSGAAPGKRCWPARSTATASSRSTLTAG
jgi:acetyl-CoA C-acetyltransferase